jgi:hypothetical protein
MTELDLTTHHEVAVEADAPAADRALREVTFGDVPLVRALLFARGLGLPARDQKVLAALTRGADVVADVPGRGVTVRLEGRFWRLRGGGTEPAATATVGFLAAPGMLSTETRVHVPALSVRRFRRYWRLVGPFSGVIRKQLLAAAKRRAEAT